MEKKYWINDNTRDYVWYKLINKEGNVFRDYSNSGAACWSSFYCHDYSEIKSADKIFICAKESIMGYSEESVIRYMEILNKENFFCTYLGIDKEKGLFTWEIEVEKYNNNRLSLCSTMNFLRYLWMGSKGFVVDKLLQLVDENPEIDLFYALQAAHISKDYEFYTAEWREKNKNAYGYNRDANYCGGHSLKSTSINTPIISRETWLSNLEHPYAKYGGNGPRFFLNDGWEREYLPKVVIEQPKIKEEPIEAIVQDKPEEPIQIPEGFYQQIKKQDFREINIFGGNALKNAIEDAFKEFPNRNNIIKPYAVENKVVEKKKIVKKKSKIPIDAEEKPRNLLKEHQNKINVYNEVPAIIKKPVKKVIKKA